MLKYSPSDLTEIAKHKIEKKKPRNLNGPGAIKKLTAPIQKPIN